MSFDSVLDFAVNAAGFGVLIFIGAFILIWTFDKIMKCFDKPVSKWSETPLKFKIDGISKNAEWNCESISGNLIRNGNLLNAIKSNIQEIEDRQLFNYERLARIEEKLINSDKFFGVEDMSK
jgi:hypothetical protein